MKHFETVSPAEFLLWGFLKDSVCSHNPRNVEDLKHNTEQTVANTDRKTFRKVEKKTPVKSATAYLQNDADIFSINSNYIFASHFLVSSKK